MQACRMQVPCNGGRPRACDGGASGTCNPEAGTMSMGAGGTGSGETGDRHDDRLPGMRLTTMTHAMTEDVRLMKGMAMAILRGRIRQWECQACGACYLLRSERDYEMICPTDGRRLVESRRFLDLLRGGGR